MVERLEERNVLSKNRSPNRYRIGDTKGVGVIIESCRIEPKDVQENEGEKKS